MENFQYSKVNRLSFLPNPFQCKEHNLVEKIQDAVKNLETKEDTKMERSIADLLVARLNSSTHNPWGKSEYGKLLNSIKRMTNEQLHFLDSSISKCLCASDEMILAELEEFASRVDYYPEVERTYLKEEKRYLIEEREIEVTDCFTVIRLLLAQMRKYNYATTKQLFDSADDFSMVYEMIAGIANSSDQSVKDAYLEGFDQSFAMICDLSLFSDVYDKYREYYFTHTLAILCQLYENQCQRKAYEENKEFMNYAANSKRILEKRTGSFHYDNWRRRSQW